MKWCWTLVIIRKMRVKPTVRFRLTPVRTAIVTESTGNKGWRGCGEKGTLLHCWRECILVQPRWRNVWRLFKNLKLELPYDPEIPLQGGISRENYSLKRSTHPYVYSSSMHNSQDLETTYMSIDRWTDKEVVQVPNGLLAIKKNKIMPTWTDLELSY